MICPYCDRPISIPHGTRKTVRFTPILVLSCPSCSKVVGVVNANQ